MISSMGDKIAELRGLIEELKKGIAPEAIVAAEQRALELGKEVGCLRSQLEDVERRHGEVKGKLE